MAQNRFLLAVASHILLIKDGKILLQLRQNTGFEDGKYALIGGHLEGGEPLTAATAREAKEELGISIKPEDLEFVHVTHNSFTDYERLCFYFTAKEWEGEPHIAEPEFAKHLAWFDLNILPENLAPYHRWVLDKYKRRLYFSEYGWEGCCQ